MSRKNKVQKKTTNWNDEMMKQELQARRIELQRRRLDNSGQAAAVTRKWLLVIGGAVSAIYYFIVQVSPVIEHLLK